MRSDGELKKIAQELIQNEIFMSDQVRNPSDIALVFMTLSMLTKEQAEEMRKNKIAVLYAYLKNRLPMCVNGYPIFAEHYELTKEEYKKIREFEIAARKVLADVLGPTPSKEGTDGETKPRQEEPVG